MLKLGATRREAELVMPGFTAFCSFLQLLVLRHEMVAVRATSGVTFSSVYMTPVLFFMLNR